MIPTELLPLRILLVDDDEWSIEFLQTLLRAHGFEHVEGITDSRRVVNAVKADMPDLLVLDLHMPEVDGYEVLNQLRTLVPSDNYLPVLVVTGDSTPETRRRVLANGAADFLNKPYDESEVVLRVVNQLRVRWQHTQLQARNEVLDKEAKINRQIADALGAASARLGALVENLQAALVVEDEFGRISLVNQKFTQFFGLKPSTEELSGSDYAPIAAELSTHFADPGRFLARQHEVARNRELVTNEEIELADGRVLERDFVPIFYLQHYRGHLWAYREITARKQVDRELAEARDAALQSARLKAEFLANMSHEIRTPINGVVGMLELLAETPLSGDQNYLLQTAHTSAEALLDIINEILDFSKIEAGKLVVEDTVFSPLSVVEESLLVVAGGAQAKGLELIPWVEPGVPRKVRGDALRIRQILTNFLSNAVKFTASGEIVVRAYVQPPKAPGEPERLRFEVSDTGQGIPDADQCGLFMPFIQGDGSTTRRYGGTGLGLAISRQLAELMNGEVGVDSSIGEGSTFWFSWPLRVEEDDQDAPETSPHTFRGVRALVIEDNSTARLLLLKQLEIWGVAGAGAPDGEDAVKQLRFAAGAGNPYDFIVVDGDLPEKQIRDLAAQLDKDPLLAGIQVLHLIPLHRGPLEEPFTNAIARLPKPIRPSQLLDGVRLALGMAVEPRPATRRGSRKWEQLEASPATGTHILVADDNAINREVVVRWLEKWGHRVSHASNGKEAVELAARIHFDLILMDCQMPEMDGYEASSTIRAGHGASEHVPIIAVTAHALHDDREKCLRAGMDDYLPKPIRTENLAAMVTLWLGKQREMLIEPEADDKPAGNDVIDEAPRPVLDETMLDDIRGAIGMEGFQQLALMFIEQVPVHENALREGLRAGDCTALARTAHTLKGMSLQFGARDVAAGCILLEQQAKSQEILEVGRTVERIIDDLELAAAELAAQAQ